MEVVSENSEAEIARMEALSRVEGKLRDLAGNILRVVRGAGEAHEIPRQAQSFIDALVDYQTAIGRLPPSDVIAKTLSIKQALDFEDEEYDEKIWARELIISGALRIAAARILDQRLQVVAGDNDFDSGLDRYERARDALRKKRVAEQMQWPHSPSPPRKPGGKRK